MQIDPTKIAKAKLHQILLGSVAPRPIALASTIDRHGKPNLSPFSFFNVFGVNPTTLIFSPARRGRENSTKHTYDNVKEVSEVVINVVTKEIVQQVSLASTEYPEGVNEFIKSGFTMISSTKVKPFRVKESPVQFECKVREVIETGNEGGAGNLVICEILMIHVDDAILDEQGLIDANKIRLVGRMGGNHYNDAFGDAIFDVEKPLQTLGVGVDQLPDHVRLSKVLTGNDLGQLANVESLPDEVEMDAILKHTEVQEIIRGSGNQEEFLHHLAKDYIAQGKIRQALCIVMIKS
jgi:flavin reductase (DIM6/NTAB) family NADH-FMN oxidoreductase RutF